jgi:hypothetical protein
MSGFFRKVEAKPARKAHRCEACYHTIAVGEIYKEQTGVWDGSAFRNRYHAECFDELCADGTEEFTPGSFEPPARLVEAAAGESQ